MNDKLVGFPTVNYTSLVESVDRREFMRSQCERYGIKHNPFVTERLTNMTPQPIIHGKYVAAIGEAVGIVIGHLECLKSWYYNTDEEMAIFCEDDHDLSSIDYWNFTWQEFLDNLPKDWECIQLIRIISPLNKDAPPHLTLKLYYGRFWGSCSLMRRSWVKKILDRHIIGDDEYMIEVGDFTPMVENVLFLELGVIYNFPLLTENNSFMTTLDWGDINTYMDNKIPHRIAEKFIKQCWATLDPNIKIEDMLRL